MTAAAAVQTTLPSAALLIHPNAWGLVKSVLDSSGLVFDPVGAYDMPRYLVSTAEPGETRNGLTARELQVLQLVAQGNDNPEIAKLLFLSLDTIKTHMAKLLRKLDARSRAQAVAVGYQRGILGGAA